MTEQTQQSNHTGAQKKAIYHLPYPHPLLDSFLQVAENAQNQASINELACRRAMTNNENTMTDIMPAFPQVQDSYTSSIVYSTRSLMLSAESAYQAQSSVCEALTSALDAAVEEHGKLLQRVNELSGELTDLEQETAALRAAFTSITDDPSANEAYATEEAQKLLVALETAYQKHDRNRILHQKIGELEADIEYLTAAEANAHNYLTELETLSKRTKDEWNLVVNMLHIDPAEFDKQTPVIDVFADQAAEAARLAAEQEAEKQAAEEDAEPEEDEDRPSPWRTIWSYVKIIIVAFLIAFVLRAYIFDVTRVEGTSMYPTLQDGDNLITSKISYRITEPLRGDIVVLDAPDLPGHDYIKRVIGLPNEEIRIENDKVYIDDELLNEPYLDGVATDGSVFMVIPDGYYFVMGDNRDDSRDSRVADIGVISKDALEGKALFRIFPLSDFGSIY